MSRSLPSSLAVFFLLFVSAACAPEAASVPATAQEPAPATPAATELSGRVRVAGTEFVKADGTPFLWRGITAFRLVEMVAAGREADAVAYLDWARRNDVTVVRVLTMARHLFELAPADGVAALPRLLTLAAERGVHVEVVALADTAAIELDIDAHVAAVGRIAAAHANAFLEIANEPFHQTQHASLHDRATLARLAALVQDDIVVAYGSGRTIDDSPDGESGGGDYVTVHMPRGGEPWAHVTALAAGADLVASYGRPVVSDEPIGAAAAASRGRRDNAPERFRAAALLTRMTGMHATFHYEGGLQARIPEGAELASFHAWREAWTLLPARFAAGTFRAVPSGQGMLFEAQGGGETWTLAVRAGEPPPGAVLVKRWDGSALFRSASTR